MRHLKRFNEKLTQDDHFPNADEAVETIDFYIKQWEDYDFNIVRIPGFGPEWNIFNIDTDKIVYYFRVFPNEIPESTKEHLKNFTPRIDCTITTKIENIETLKELYRQINFLPQELLNDDLYARIYFNDDVGISTHCFIYLIVYSTQEDLDESNDRIKFQKNWGDVKKRQNQ
jgi:hypothetical protein